MKDAESGYKFNSSSITKDSVEASMENFRNIKLYSHLNFLLIGLITSEIQIHVFGLFCCGVINLKQHLPLSAECKILSADIIQNLKSLVAIINVHYNGINSLECIIIDTVELFNRSQDLYIVSCKRGSILNTVNNIHRAMINIIEAHEHIVIQEMQMQIFEYSKGKEEGTLSAEFMELLLFGFYSAELATFLLSELSDKKLKKISSSIEVSHSNILKQIVYHLRPNIERLLFELSTMLGLSRLSCIFPESKIIIKEDLIYKCMIAAGAFNMKANKILHILEDSSIKYKSFFRWLTSAASIITNERVGNSPFEISQREMNFICEYLCEIDSSTPIFEKDELGQYLTDKELIVNNEDSAKNLWRKFLIDNPCLEEYELIIPISFENKSLVQMHKYLTDTTESIFKNFTQYIKNDFPVSYNCNLYSSHMNIVRKVSLIEAPKTEKILIAFMKPQNDNRDNLLDLVEIPQKWTLTQIPKIASLYFEENEYGKFDLIDIQFYTNEIISILLDKNDRMHSFYVQLAVENVQNFYNRQPQNLFTIIDKDCLKMIENMKSLKFAVSGQRKVSVIVADDGHRVRIFEMEAEDEDENTTNSNNVSTEEANVVSTKVPPSDFSENDFSSNFEDADSKTDTSRIVVDESEDRIRPELGVIDFGDIDVNTLSILSDFTSIEELIARDNVPSLDVELEKDIASLAITSAQHSQTSNSSDQSVNPKKETYIPMNVDQI